MSARGVRLRSRPPVALAIGGLVFAAVTGLRLWGALQPLELWAYDGFLRARSGEVAEEPPVALIRIYEEDIRRFGHPLPDALLLRALEALMAAEPRTIGVDLYRDAPVPAPSDARSPTNAYRALGARVTGTDRIVMIMKLPAEDGRGGVPAPAFARGTGRVGFSDLPADPGGVIRRGFLFLWSDDTQHLSFSLQLALRYLRAEGIGLTRDAANPNHARLGETTIPPFRGRDGGYAGADDGGYQFLLDYRLGSGAFPSFSLRELLAGEIAPEAIRDRIAILGTTAPSVKDHFYAPSGPGLPGQPSLYGIEVHAHAVSQLLRFARGEARPLRSWNEAGEALWILLWSLCGAALGLWKRSPWLVAGAGLAGLAVPTLGAFALFAQDWWIPVVPPLLAGVGSAGLVSVYVAAAERAERREVTRLFSRFLRPSVAEEIWRQRDQFMDGDRPGRPRSQWVTLTVLISDLKGYTEASESMDPYLLMDWVNEYMQVMANLVERHGGIVDDYAGDGIKAHFGFPVPRTREPEIDADAASAVRCAVAMGAEMERLNAAWRERELPMGRVRIGIFTGPVVVGSLGSDQSLKYTSVGDTVNTAARLESFDKDGFDAETDGSSWRVLIGEETRRRLGDAFRTLDLGPHRLTGKKRVVRIHRVLGPAHPGGTQ